MKSDNSNTYASVARFLHWSMALAYVAMFAMALAWNINEDWAFLIKPH